MATYSEAELKSAHEGLIMEVEALKGFNASESQIAQAENNVLKSEEYITKNYPDTALAKSFEHQAPPSAEVESPVVQAEQRQLPPELQEMLARLEQAVPGNPGILETAENMFRKAETPEDMTSYMQAVEKIIEENTPTQKQLDQQAVELAREDARLAVVEAELSGEEPPILTEPLMTQEELDQQAIEIAREDARLAVEQQKLDEQELGQGMVMEGTDNGISDPGMVMEGTDNGISDPGMVMEGTDNGISDPGMAIESLDSTAPDQLPPEVLEAMEGLETQHPDLNEYPAASLMQGAVTDPDMVMEAADNGISDPGMVMEGTDNGISDPGMVMEGTDNGISDPGMAIESLDSTAPDQLPPEVLEAMEGLETQHPDLNEYPAASLMQGAVTDPGMVMEAADNGISDPGMVMESPDATAPGQLPPAVLAAMEAMNNGTADFGDPREEPAEGLTSYMAGQPTLDTTQYYDDMQVEATDNNPVFTDNMPDYGSSEFTDNMITDPMARGSACDEYGLSDGAIKCDVEMSSHFEAACNNMDANCPLDNKPAIAINNDLTADQPAVTVGGPGMTPGNTQ